MSYRVQSSAVKATRAGEAWLNQAARMVSAAAGFLQSGIRNLELEQCLLIYISLPQFYPPSDTPSRQICI